MSDGSFPDFYEEQKDRVDDALDAGLPPADENYLAEVMRYSVLGGGKRIRGILVLEAARLGEPVERDVAETLSAVVELVHTYTLVHDDLPAMDDDDVRRGQPACHEKYDEATAILCGNALLSRAFELTGGLGDSFKDVGPLIRKVASVMGYDGVLDGQVRDLDLEGDEPEEDEILEMYERKTGYLIGLALELGAIAGTLDRKAREDLRNVGRTLGRAFQIQDDLLEHEGSSEQLGKDAGSDASRHKSTLVEHLGPEQARNRADRYVQTGRETLQDLPHDTTRLETLADFLVERNY
jgi:geranylgeranyl pyrophosphate synthase